jgi:PAS domain S-box-containing protein
MEYQLLDSAPDAMLVADADGRIVFVNHPAEQLLGYHRDELIGVSFEFVIPGSHHQNASAGGTRSIGAAVEAYARGKDGLEFPIEINFSRLDTPLGVRVMSAIRNIADRRKVEAKFRSLLESAPDAMVIVDARGQIVLVNAQTERLFGYGRDELLHRPVEMLVPERFRGGHVTHRTAFVAAGYGRPMDGAPELCGLRKDGTEVAVEISLSPLETEEGTLVATAIRDITNRKRADAERARFIEERAAHAEANRVKDEFLATLSHELRTPLNAILGWVAMLKGETLDPGRVQHALATIERNGRALAQLVEDLLDLSRVITGKLYLKLARVDMAQLVDQAIDVVRPSAQARRIQLESIVGQRPVLLLADADRLQQAVWNLLANAIKFTPDNGRVETHVSAGDSSVTVMVRDTGKGIDPMFVPHVFDRFRQEDSSTTRLYGGLGLGLAIVRSVVEAHGGTVRAFSAGAGQGATFTIDLPLVHLEERCGEPTDSRREPVGQLAGLRILVVDDAPDERELLAEILGQHGATVERGASVTSALDIAERFLPDVVVSDIAMPNDDGYVLLRRLRDHVDSRLANVPVVAVTALGRVEDRTRALTAGFARCLSKPVEAAPLVLAVAAVASRPVD